VGKIHDMDSFLDMPLKNIRKLWKLMFDEAWRNDESIENLEQWLPNTHARLGAEVQFRECELAQALHIAEEARRTKAAYGSVISKPVNEALKKAQQNARYAERMCKQSKRDLVRIEKLQLIFAEFTK